MKLGKSEIVRAMLGLPTLWAGPRFRISKTTFSDRIYWIYGIIWYEFCGILLLPEAKSTIAQQWQWPINRSQKSAHSFQSAMERPILATKTACLQI
jgi:hypothetical protein